LVKSTALVEVHIAVHRRKEGWPDAPDSPVHNKANEYFFSKFDGTLTVPQSGQYEISLESGDGSKLFLDGEEVSSVVRACVTDDPYGKNDAQIMDNDGCHGLESESEELQLVSGQHSLVVRHQALVHARIGRYMFTCTMLTASAFQSERA
jgi:hypothetical protein